MGPASGTYRCCDDSVDDAEGIRPQNQKKKIVTWDSSTIKQFKLTKDAIIIYV